MNSMLVLLALVCACGFGQGALWWPWEDKDSSTNTPEWDELSVTWGKFSSLPTTMNDAKSKGWTNNTSKCQGKQFYGYRFILSGDPTVMLLFDSNGKIAGMQMGVFKSLVKAKQRRLPWNSEGDMYTATVYFTDPKNICGGTRPNPKYMGDKLVFQTGLTPDKFMEIPHSEKDVKKQATWVPGKCFFSMGMHYWYKVSKNMNCDNFFPLFVMYNGGNLNAFGFVLEGNVQSPRVEHPGPFASKLTFASETRPRCLDNSKPKRSSMHVYLQGKPYLNFC